MIGNSRTREWQIQTMLLDRLQLIYEVRLRREIRRAMKQGRMPDDHITNMRAIIFSLYERTAEVFAEYAIKGKKRTVPNINMITSVMQEWSRWHGAELVAQITEQTRKDIAEVVGQAVREGLSSAETATLINSVATSKSASRALTIARTETGRASSATMHNVAKSMNVEMTKTWVASKSGSTRRWHQDVDGQTVGLDEMFIVDGEHLKYPRDSSGSAGNTINCRCVVKYNMV